MTHHLDPLLRPKSIAVVGASDREYSLGQETLKNLTHGQYPGAIYAVNPRRTELLGLRCYPDLVSLPETPNLVIFCVGDNRVEALLDDAIEIGARQCAIGRG